MRRIARVLALCMVAPACECGGEPIEAVVVELRVAPARLDFGHLPVGARATATLTIINDGNGAYAPAAAPSLQGASFSVVTPCAVPIAPTSMCEMTVAFAPAAEGDSTGSVTVEAPDGSALAVPLTGTGDPAAVAVAPSSLAFGALMVGSSARQSFSVTNLSSARLDLPLAIDGAGFVVGGAAAALVSLDPGQATDVAVDFLPARGGPYAARAVVEICGPLCGPGVELAGEGLAPRIEAEPRAVDWGEVAVGSSATATVEIGNGGAGELVVTSFDVLGSAAVAVTSDPLPLQIAQGASATVTLQWSPSVPVAALGASLLVRSNDPVSPDVFIPLDGVSPGPALQLVPAALHFGILDEGQGQEVEVVARSSGTVPVAVSNVLVDGDGFSLVPPAPGAFTLDPGAARVLRLRAQADAAAVANGGREGTLTVHSDAANDAVMPLAFLSGTAGCQPRASAPNANLGAVPLGRGATASITIANVGDATCVLQSAGPAPALAFDDGFSFSAARVASIAPGGTGEIEVGFVASTAGMASAFVSVSFESTGADVLVSATARGVTGALVGDPPLLELGPTLEGCPARSRSAGFLNDGSAAVTVDAVELVPATAPFTLAAPTLPALVTPGALLSVGVTAGLASAGTHEADVVATTSSGLRASTHVRLLVQPGGAPITESFVVAGTTAVDVLFVVDNSGSMADDQEILASNFDAFIDAAAGEPNLDFHLGVTTTDVLGGTGGPFVAPFLRDSSAGLATQFAEQVHVGVGGSGLELGLEAMRRALDDFASSTNAGFLRSEAALSVVIVSDEEDSGAIPDVAVLDPTAARLPEAYVEFLDGLKAGTVTNAPVLVSMVGTPLIAPRYQHVALAFGGVFLDISAVDWGENLSAIGAATFGLQRLFRLGTAPEPGSVVVTVDGVATTAFSLVPAANAVVLDEAPPEGALVVISYRAGC